MTSRARTSKLMSYVNYRKSAPAGPAAAPGGLGAQIGGTRAAWGANTPRPHSRGCCRHASDARGWQANRGQVRWGSSRLLCCQRRGGGAECHPRRARPQVLPSAVHCPQAARRSAACPTPAPAAARRFMAYDKHMDLVLGDAEEFRTLPPKKGKSEEEVRAPPLPPALPRRGGRAARLLPAPAAAQLRRAACPWAALPRPRNPRHFSPLCSVRSGGCWACCCYAARRLCR